MPVSRISRKRVVVKLPALSANRFFGEEKRDHSDGYVRHIVLRHLEEKNLPIYSFGSLPDNRG